MFSRSAKTIRLSREVRKLLGIDAGVDAAGRTDPRDAEDATVDLLWNGGIGTYVKATNESHADVGDRSNDAVRVNAASCAARSSARAATSA